MPRRRSISAAFSAGGFPSKTKTSRSRCSAISRVVRYRRPARCEVTCPCPSPSGVAAGGMGEVYRARDPKLNRDVALKVLPEALAADAERMARFEREAQVLAALNHPGIAAIHGLEESNATRALVMELVEGSTLSDRI